MSIETSIASTGTFVFSMKLTKSVVSLMYEFCCCAIGLSNLLGWQFFRMAITSNTGSKNFQ